MAETYIERLGGLEVDGKFVRIAVVLGLLVHVGGFLLISVVTDTVSQIDQESAYVYLGEQAVEKKDRWFEEQALLNDSEPLLLDTKWNATPAINRSKSELNTFPELGYYEVPLLNGSESLGATLDALGNAESFEPYGVLAVLEKHIKLKNYSSFGKTGVDHLPLKPRIGIVEVYRFGELQPLLTQTISANEIDSEMEAVDLWEFAEFLVQLEVTGMNGLPLMSKSSGSEALDLFWQQHFEKAEFLRQLRPGYYKIVVGP